MFNRIVAAVIISSVSVILNELEETLMSMLQGE